MSLESRLKRLEAIAAAKHQTQSEQSYLDLLQVAEERFRGIPDEQVLREYEQAINAPSTDPRIIAEIAKLDGMSCEELIKEYMKNL
ncbi:MAG: hypothetical protein KME16_23595 [Scytolyngbya sp. HA4215-MV1]|jgi:ribosomal protein L12E/L44/L45/RPP1/RPP2|nr:hypothetical protein [Scytolyngbya sp. HA4215-MV1]